MSCLRLMPVLAMPSEASFGVAYNANNRVTADKTSKKDALNHVDAIKPQMTNGNI